MPSGYVPGTHMVSRYDDRISTLVCKLRTVLDPCSTDESKELGDLLEKRREEMNTGKSPARDRKHLLAKPDPQSQNILWGSGIRTSGDGLYIPVALLVEAVARSFLLAAGVEHPKCDTRRSKRTFISAKAEDGLKFSGGTTYADMTELEFAEMLAQAILDDPDAEKAECVTQLLGAILNASNSVKISVSRAEQLCELLGVATIEETGVAVQRLVAQAKASDEKAKAASDLADALGKENEELKRDASPGYAAAMRQMIDYMVAGGKEDRHDLHEAIRDNQKLTDKVCRLQEENAALRTSESDLSSRLKSMASSILGIATRLAEELDEEKFLPDTPDALLLYVTRTVEALLVSRNMEPPPVAEQAPTQQMEMLKNLALMRLMFGGGGKENNDK